MSSEPILMSMVQAAPVDGAAGGLINFIMPMVLVFGIFYILVLRPQHRRVNEHQAALAAVKRGDEVITAGGIRGKVIKVSDDEAEVEIAQGVRVRVIKNTISQVLNPNSKPAND